MGLTHQLGDVQRPGQIGINEDAQEPDVVHMLHRLSLYEERSMFSLLGPPVVHNDLLGLAGVQGKVVFRTLFCHVLNLLSVASLIAIRYETHYNGVICKLHNYVCGEDGSAVVCEQSGLSTQPCGVPVLGTSDYDVLDPGTQ